MKLAWHPHFVRLSALADRFLPDGLTDPEAIRQKRTVVLGAVVGLVFSNGTALSYGSMGSLWSAAAVTLITLGLITVPSLVRRGVSTAAIGHVMTALTAQAALVVAARSGGLESPAAAWFFMLPLISYLASGYTASLGWGAASLVAMVGLYLAERAGVVFGHDFSPQTQLWLRVTGYPGVVISTALLLMMVESVRLASLSDRDRANRMLERGRLLRDMHDGVGGHLMSLIVRGRANQLAGTELVRGLEACLDDLRLVVNSLEPVETELEVALGELRHRSMSQCAAVGVMLDWRSEGLDEVRLPGEQTLEVLRASQEMLSNAIRHANAQRIELRLTRGQGAPARLVLAVRDDGVGFDPDRPPRRGHGLSSLAVRAQHLGGQLAIEAAHPGTQVTLTFPLQRPP